MKTISLLVLALVASTASAAVIESFDAWTGGGAVVADPDNAANNVLKLVGGETVSIALSGPGIVTMDVYDFGVTIQDDEGAGVGTAYGPRWGVAGDGGSVAATIIAKTFLNATKGYGYGTEASRTSSWWSPMWFGGPRQVDALQVIGSGTPAEPEVVGDGAWTTWTFAVTSGGSVYINNGVNSQSVNAGVGAVSEVWLSGGKGDGNAIGAAGVLVDNVTFTVPEPATMSLLALGGLALIRRR